MGIMDEPEHHKLSELSIEELNGLRAALEQFRSTMDDEIERAIILANDAKVVHELERRRALDCSKGEYDPNNFPKKTIKDLTKIVKELNVLRYIAVENQLFDEAAAYRDLEETAKKVIASKRRKR